MARRRGCHRRGACARCKADRRGSAPDRTCGQGRPLATGAAGDGRSGRAVHCLGDDRARLVRRRLRARLDQRSVPGARRRWDAAALRQTATASWPGTKGVAPRSATTPRRAPTPSRRSGSPCAAPSRSRRATARSPAVPRSNTSPRCAARTRPTMPRQFRASTPMRSGRSRT